MAYRKFYQPHARQWSQWVEMARTTYFACCDCGLVHAHQFRVILLKGRLVKIMMRTRRHKAKTMARRQQVRHSHQPHS
jgi:hypothetical protein